MKILLAGPPACGKGSQGDKLRDNYGIPLISVGQVLRDLPKDHPRYEENIRIMNSGGLSPNDLVAQLISERLSHIDCVNGYILDGYGRRMKQVELFEPDLDAVLFINIPPEETIKRISGRRLCTSDDEIYNIFTLPKEELEKCKGELIQRDDDKEEVVKERLRKYEEETKDVIEYFRSKGLVHEIDGLGTPEEVYARVESVLKDLDLI